MERKPTKNAVNSMVSKKTVIYDLVPKIIKDGFLL